MKFGLRRTLLTILLTVRFAIVTTRTARLAMRLSARSQPKIRQYTTATKIRELLDGVTLGKAALIADEIKGWDKKVLMILDHSIFQDLETLTASCAISGGQIHRRQA